MSIVKQFPSPRAAQVWFLGRRFVLFWPGMILLSLQSGYFDCSMALEYENVSPLPSGDYLLFAPLFALIACTIPTEIVYPLRRTAGGNAPFVQAELFHIWLLLVAAAFAYWLPFSLMVDNGVYFGLSPLVYSAAIASTVQALGWGLRCLRHQLAVLVGIVPIQQIAYYGLDHLNPFGSALNPISLSCACLAVYLTYRTSLFFAGRFRHEETRPTMFRRGSKMRLVQVHQHADPMAKPPFPSRLAASTWYEHRHFWPDAAHASFFTLYSFGLFFYVSFGMSDMLPGASGIVYALAAFGLGLVLVRCSILRTGFEFQLPLSDWSLAVAFLRALPAWLAGACTIFVFSIALSDLMDSAAEVAVQGAVVSDFILGLWTGWVSVAFAPGMFPTLLAALYFKESPSDILVPACVAVNLAVILGLIAIGPGEFRCAARRPFPYAPVIAATAVLAASFVLTDDSIAHWCMRELLGAGFVTALLHHLHQNATIPPKAARAIARVLALGVLASCGVAIAFGPLVNLNQGPVSIYLAFGLVPPLFLPLIIAPVYVGWMRALLDRNGIKRRGMQWKV